MRTQTSCRSWPWASGPWTLGLTGRRACASSAKNGPDLIRPNSSRSIFMTGDTPTSTRYWKPPFRTASCARSRAARTLASSVAALAARAAFRPPGQPALAHSHEHVLDERADDRRVVGDALDAEPGRGDDACEIVVIGERVHVIRFAQPLQPQIERGPCARRAAATAIREPHARRRPAVLAHVRVDEQRAIGGQHAIGFGEHVGERLG